MWSKHRAYFLTHGVFFVAGAVGVVGCGKKGGSVISAEGSFAFLAQDYTKGAIVYNYNLDTKSLNKIHVAEGNQDWKLFWNETSRQTYLLDRTTASSTSASIITAFAGSTVVGQVGGLPKNTRCLLRVSGSALWAGGYTGEVAVLQAPATMKTPVASMTYPSGNGTSYYKNIVGMLTSGNDVWAVFGGTDLSYNTYQAAVSKIDLAGRSFGAVTSISGCKNIASGSLLPNEGMVALSTSKMVVSCNPQYGTNGEPVALVMLEAKATGVEATLLKSATTNSTLHMYEISGASADGSEVFVEEKSYNASTYATTTTKRYWLNVSTKAETDVSTHGGHMFFDTRSGKYIFGCYVENGACKDKTFALVTPGSTTVEPLTLSFEYNFNGFAERIR
jgi:hypothetical protein